MVPGEADAHAAANDDLVVGVHDGIFTVAPTERMRRWVD